MYRYGTVTNIYDETDYAIQKKNWFGIWCTIKKYSTNEAMMSAVENLRKSGKIVL